ncbi:50S ribosomal protein L18 [Methylophaga sp. OBS1]|jgi:large subunit ribosomal protein L18|uniref:50S ribosomal protein L18 n=1 Tax=Methylophaga sp. OBS1 TaxID=2991933 RepID=UPI002255E36E|nr:50S ribosomal protein L18 [Methylophaga sp. OBS1]MCX4193927.1 50S ribosomal protein L18 [Methylophaga sp. OBS1]
MDKKISRLRRAARARAKLRELEVYRLTVHRTPRHIYAQVLTHDSSKVIASASTLDPEVKKDLKNTGNVDAATVVGKIIAERAAKEGIKEVAFDRSGFRYHGRVKALADAARENGLQF